MANREELIVIRAARAGQAAAQLTLGKRYLFGGAGLPKSDSTALYWLDRAAHQDQGEAWLLIGSHIPFEAAARAAQPAQVCVWYERAFDSGILQAGLVLAKLVLAQAETGTSDELRRKAWMALEAVAHAGIGEAQWLMAQLIGQTQSGHTGSGPGNRLIAHAFLSSILKLPSSGRATQAVLEWTTRAAKAGVISARQAMADHAWQAGDRDRFLYWAIPLARDIVGSNNERSSRTARTELRPDEVALVARCAETLHQRGGFDRAELERLLDFAARGGDIPSSLTLGLWFGRLDREGKRIGGEYGMANYKKALRWLAFAGDGGLATAWYAISRIYLKPEFSQRSLTDAHRYLRMAANAGHIGAQVELGLAAWRARNTIPKKDIEAVYWLGRAASQNDTEASRLIKKIVDDVVLPEWAATVMKKLTREHREIFPLMVARIELSIEFGQSRAEALLLDLGTADCEHCLAVDIRSAHPRSKRRLVMVQTTEQRRVLSRTVRMFEGIDCSIQGPEGNYRQRLYRLRMMGDG